MSLRAFQRRDRGAWPAVRHVEGGSAITRSKMARTPTTAVKGAQPQVPALMSIASAAQVHQSSLTAR